MNHRQRFKWQSSCSFYCYELFWPSPPVPNISRFISNISQYESLRSIFNFGNDGSDIGWDEKVIMVRSEPLGDARLVIEYLEVNGENYAKACGLLGTPPDFS